MSSPTNNPPRGLWMRLRPLRWLAAGYLGAMVLAMFFEEQLVFFPSPYPRGEWNPPGFEFEDAWFEAPDGTKLHGWYVRHPEPRAVVLFHHGNAGNVSHRAELAHQLRRRVGASVLLYDYRGFGRSLGRPSERGILDDARAARAWLAAREGIPQERIVMMGESLGGAVAVALAADDGARALVLQSTFTSLPDVAAHHYFWLPVRWMMRTRLDSAAKIPRYRGPLLQSHAGADTIVPLALGQRLFDRANEPKRLLVFAGADHNDFPPPEYFDALREFLDSAP